MGNINHQIPILDLECVTVGRPIVRARPRAGSAFNFNLQNKVNVNPPNPRSTTYEDHTSQTSPRDTPCWSSPFGRRKDDPSSNYYHLLHEHVRHIRQSVFVAPLVRHLRSRV